jgi:hypothetical protein
LWDQIDHAYLFTLAAVVAIIAFLVVWRFIHFTTDQSTSSAD